MAAEVSLENFGDQFPLYRQGAYTNLSVKRKRSAIPVRGSRFRNRYISRDRGSGTLGYVIKYDRAFTASNDFLIDHDLFYLVLRWDVVHDIQHGVLENGT